MEEKSTNSNSNLVPHSDYIFKPYMMQRQGEESEGSEENLIPDQIKVKIKDAPLAEREIDTESHLRNTQERDSDYKPTEEGRVLFIKQKSRKLTKIIR
jgi:hypothetical protein